MSIDSVAFGGWPHCLRLANPQVELLITLDVGPRLISYKAAGGENVLKVNADELGTVNEERFVGRGGHRFWIAPEDQRTYAPDNASVDHELVGANGVRLTNTAAAPWWVRKELTVSLASEGSAVTIEHRAINDGKEPTSLATWGLTVMTAGGLEIIPQPALGEHPRDLLPNRTMVMWPYTDMADERWRWGRRFITLRHAAKGPAAKLGLAHREKWIAYLTKDTLFIKTFHYEQGATYPDFGCNFETFTNPAILEIETLGPLRSLAPGEAFGHSEKWHLFGSIAPPDSAPEDALAEWLAPFLARIEL